MHKLIALLLVTVVLASDAPGSTEEPEGSSVVQLTKDTFESTIASGNVMVEFYAPWCGFCKKLRPTYTKLASEMEGEAVLAKVDATAEKDLGERFGVRGYPTLKFFADGKVYEYDGDRSEDDLRTYIRGGYKQGKGKKIPSADQAVLSTEEPEDSKVIILTRESLETTVLRTPQPVVLIEFYAEWCGHCKHLAPTYTEIAEELSEEGILVTKINANQEKGVGTQFGVSGYPTIKLIGEDGLVYDYEGARDAHGLTEFARGGYKSGQGKPFPEPPSPEEEQTEDEPASSRVLQLNGDADLDVKNKKNIIFAKFYAPWCGHCKALAPKWRKLANDTELSAAKIHFAKLDCTKYPDAQSRFGVSGFPTLIYFRNNKMRVYDGAREIEDLKKFALSGYKEVPPKPIPSMADKAVKEDPKAWMAEPETSRVKILDDASFDSLTGYKEPSTVPSRLAPPMRGSWLVEFVSAQAPKAKALAEHLRKLGVVLLNKGISIGRAELLETYELGKRFGVDGEKDLPVFFLVKDSTFIQFDDEDLDAEAKPEEYISELKSFASGEYEDAVPAALPPRPVSYVEDLSPQAMAQHIQNDDCFFFQIYAKWCMPCKMSRPNVEKIATILHTNYTKCKVGRIEGDKNRELLAGLNITGYPSFYLLSRQRIYKRDLDQDSENNVKFIMDVCSSSYTKTEALDKHYAKEDVEWGVDVPASLTDLSAAGQSEDAVAGSNSGIPALVFALVCCAAGWYFLRRASKTVPVHTKVVSPSTPATGKKKSRR